MIINKKPGNKKIRRVFANENTLDVFEYMNLVILKIQRKKNKNEINLKIEMNECAFVIS